MSQRSRTRSQNGFSLIELMIVVAIIGVLAALAVPTFMSYIYKTEVSEATTFISSIRERQEAYRSEFGQYADLTNDPEPTGAGVGPQKIAWPAMGAGTGWGQLGAVPDGPTRFLYTVTAGAPPTAGPTWGFDGTDFWFAATALGDLNGDGHQMLVESVSGNNTVLIARSDRSTNNFKGWD